MKITAQDLLDLMPIVKDRGWRITNSGDIRDKNYSCPVCALANEICGYECYGTDAWAAIYEIVGNRAKQEDAQTATREIMEAADLEEYQLRPALMQALGMS